MANGITADIACYALAFTARSDSYGSYDYSRSGNPTRTALEKHVAMLERAHAAFAFSTGMAALNAVTRLLSAGDELIVGTDIYGGMHRLITRVTSMHGITIKPVDVTNVEAVRAAISDNTKMVHLESPSNPLMMISDIRALAAVCQEAGVLLSIDASMMPPVLMQCIPLGADIVVHSATKFLAGHSDTMAGIVCCGTEALAKRIAFYQNAEGTGLAPFDCWLVLRGIKTMALRVERAQSNAERIAHVLREHPRVTQVHYAGLRPLPPDEQKLLIIGKRAALTNSEVVKRRVLEAGGDVASADAAAARAEAGDLDDVVPSSPMLAGATGKPRRPSEKLLANLAVDIEKLHPLPSDSQLAARFEQESKAYATHFSQSVGGGVVMSFTTGSTHLSRRVVDAMRIFKLTVSFGACNSLVEMPCVLSHASVPPEDSEFELLLATACAR
jgi:cystathionine beta-lyase/cystathionine gamma-synthase